MEDRPNNRLNAGQQQQLGVNGERDDENHRDAGIDDDNNHNGVPPPPPPPPQVDLNFTGPMDPRRMALTEQERNWALDIRDAIEMVPEIDTVSDFMCLQLALTERDNIQNAIERVQGLQTFQEEYSIASSLQDGIQALEDLVELFPELYLSFSYSYDEQSYVLLYDATKWNAALLQSPDALNKQLKASYYMNLVFNPDAAASRNGLILIAECEGFDWKKNLVVTYLRKLHEELLNFYPQTYRQIKYFHTGVFVNTIVSMMRRFLPRDIHSKIQTGCQLEGRLNTFYHVPSIEAANATLLERMKENLKKHFENVASFKLDLDEEAPPSS